VEEKVALMQVVAGHILNFDGGKLSGVHHFYIFSIFF
jgi:hypothetical protein